MTRVEHIGAATLYQRQGFVFLPEWEPLASERDVALRVEPAVGRAGHLIATHKGNVIELEVKRPRSESFTPMRSWANFSIANWRVFSRSLAARLRTLSTSAASP